MNNLDEIETCEGTNELDDLLDSPEMKDLDDLLESFEDQVYSEIFDGLMYEQVTSLMICSCEILITLSGLCGSVGNWRVNRVTVHVCFVVTKEPSNPKSTFALFFDFVITIVLVIVNLSKTRFQKVSGLGEPHPKKNCVNLGIAQKGGGGRNPTQIACGSSSVNIYHY